MVREYLLSVNNFVTKIGTENVISMQMSENQIPDSAGMTKRLSNPCNP